MEMEHADWYVDKRWWQDFTQWQREREGGAHPPRAALCRGTAKTWNSEILHPQLSVLFTVHTDAIVVTIE